MENRKLNCAGGLQGILCNTWAMVLMAVLELVLGFVLLSFPYLLGASAIWVGGFVFLVVGALRMVQVLRPGNRLWNMVSGLVYVALGWAMMTANLPLLEIWTYVIGLCLLIVGILRALIAVSTRRDPGASWLFFNALVSILLGLMVLMSWPESSLWFIGTLIAVEMIFSGWTLLFVAIGPRKGKSKQGEDRES